MVTSAATHIPHTLPPRPSIVDRRPEVDAALTTAAACARTERSCRMWFSGEAGVGKTALAVTIAYRLADQGTDGELYADLRGSSPHEAADTFEVLGTFLRQLGITRDDLPESTQSRSALFRTLTDGRRIILVLDDAGGPAHVRDLLPNSSKAVVIATSTADHHGITGEDFEPFRTERLEPAYSAEMLTRQVGADRVAAEPDAAGRLADACGHLPLGIQVVSAELRRHPQRRLAELSAALESGLGLLRRGGTLSSPLFTPISSALRSLEPDVARAALTLSLHQGPTLRARVAAAMLAHAPDHADAMLGDLVRAALLQRTQDGGYRFRPLIAWFLEGRAESELMHPARTAAIRAMVVERLTWTAGLARALWPDRPWFGEVFAVVPPAFPPAERERAAAEFDREYDNIKAAVPAAVRHGLLAECVQLALGVKQWGYETGRTADLVDVMEHAATAVEALGDPVLAAQVYKELGTAYEADGRFDDAVDAFRRSVELAWTTGDLITVASGLEWQGIVAGQRGDLDEALTQLLAARAIVRSDGFPAGHRARADSLLSMHLGRILAALLRHAEAEREASAALHYFEEHDDPGNVLRTSLALNDALVPLGRTRAAIDQLRRALTGVDARRLRPQQMRAWQAIAAGESADGDPHAALVALAHAVELARALSLVADEVQILLDEATLHHELGDPGQAAQRLQTARSRATAALGPGAGHARILLAVATAYERFGDPTTAAESRAGADAVHPQPPAS
jgi:tetratricopeptide (TPR) repeat protein